MDTTQSAWDTFYRALLQAGHDAALHMEDDIILTQGFNEKVESVIASMPDTAIQFFSMRKADLTEGSRWDNSFLMAQCFYLPAGWSRRMSEYMLRQDRDDPKLLYKEPLDMVVRFYFKKVEKKKYWIHCPSLVDHLEGKSVIDPKRSSKRQSKTFSNPIPY